MSSTKIAAALGLAALLAGCSSTTTTSTRSAVTPEGTPAPKTVKGGVGDQLALDGSGLHDDLDDHTRTKVKITLRGTRGPIKGFDIPKNRELVGVLLRFANVGELVYDDPRPDGVLKLQGGGEGKLTALIPLGRENPCDNPSLKLKAGQSKNVCIAYEVPKGSKLASFEYVTDHGYGDTGRWAL